MFEGQNRETYTLWNFVMHPIPSVVLVNKQKMKIEFVCNPDIH